jgi:hypothetical protein
MVILKIPTMLSYLLFLVSLNNLLDFGFVMVYKLVGVYGK